MYMAIVLPDVGADGVRLSVWFSAVGDFVFEGDRLVEVLVDGATFDVPAPATGRLTRKDALPNQPLHVGQVLGLVEAEEDDEPPAPPSPIPPGDVSFRP
jgi:pyruvate/2-oxoglutarate dehydrogenase complex dihydrolipoamide acyltransferase (E2) component